MICSVSAEGSLNRVPHSIQIFLVLTLSKSFLISSAQSYLVRFQPLAQSHDIEKQNFVSLHFGFIFVDFDEAADMQCWHYFCYMYCWHAMQFWLALALICFWLSLIVQCTSEFSLICPDLCNVSTEDGGHAISQMIVLIAKIEGNCFYIILSILLVWRWSDLLKVSLQITGYVSLNNQMPLYITLSQLVFTSHCIYFYYIMICSVSSAYTIGVVSFAWPRYIDC